MLEWEIGTLPLKTDLVCEVARAAPLPSIRWPAQTNDLSIAGMYIQQESLRLT